MIYIYYVITNYTFDILYDIVKINVQYFKIDPKCFLRQTELFVEKMSPSD